MVCLVSHKMLGKLYNIRKYLKVQDMQSKEGAPMYPILFTISSLQVHVWGLLVALGVLAGVWLATRLAEGSEFTVDIVQEYVLYGVFAGLWLWQVHQTRQAA